MSKRSKNNENKPTQNFHHFKRSLEEELLYGRHVVFNVFNDERQVNRFYIQKGITGGQIQAILKKVKQQGVVIQEVPKSKLDEMTQGANHQGVVVTLPPYEYKTLDDCFQLAKQKQEDPFFMILDGIEDPHNLGSILRTADAAGVHGVIIPKRRAVGLTGTVAKTSAGAIEDVPVVRVTNISQVIQQLKDQGVWVFASAMHGEDMRSWNTTGPIAIVIGNEGAGVSPLVEESCDGTVSIPMTGRIESLNASVAAAILMYEVARHRLT